MIKVGVDIGNSKISCIVCDIKRDGEKKILSFVSNSTDSVKKSTITSIDKIKSEIKETILQAANESQTQILSVNLNIPAVDCLSIYSNSKINLFNERISNLHTEMVL